MKAERGFDSRRLRSKVVLGAAMAEMRVSATVSEVGDLTLSNNCWLMQQKLTCEGYQNRFTGTLTCVMPKHCQSTHRVVLPALCCQTRGADNRNNTLNCCCFNKHCQYMRETEQKSTQCSDYLGKLLKLLLEGLRFHTTTFSHFFCLCFEFKTRSLTHYCAFVVVLKNCFVIIGHVTGIWTSLSNVSVNIFCSFFFDFMSKVLAALHVCCLHLKCRFQSILNSNADP